MAGYDLQLWPILQGMSQLKNLYGERAGTFIANAGVQQVFGVNDFETAKWLSQVMGQGKRSDIRQKVTSRKTRHTKYQPERYRAQSADPRRNYAASS